MACVWRHPESESESESQSESQSQAQSSEPPLAASRECWRS